jgi:acyl carrier protein
MMGKKVTKEEIILLIEDICQLEGDIGSIQDLVSGGYLDSFNVLILITQLESKYGLSIEFNEDLFTQLDSTDKICTLIDNR